MENEKYEIDAAPNAGIYSVYIAVGDMMHTHQGEYPSYSSALGYIRERLASTRDDNDIPGAETGITALQFSGVIAPGAYDPDFWLDRDVRPHDEYQAAYWASLSPTRPAGWQRNKNWHLKKVTAGIVK